MESFSFVYPCKVKIFPHKVLVLQSSYIGTLDCTDNHTPKHTFSNDALVSTVIGSILL